ncbi:ComEC/Rec2 family competence protein [Methylocella sp. CPCC 101449]|uniref:ComEC/Rec2 family competence protein n=1 Tax=Methylocella sp. CPCC 101449 TaxID=2987531 RepID=UPI00288E6183|nr:ComEC/Rec2 family competence protein [Methylocella sp. CPCC 101449]MDT2021388.1 ComEC family competence protein [Methylocella sp. CPCC 101449]
MPRAGTIAIADTAGARAGRIASSPAWLSTRLSAWFAEEVAGRRLFPWAAVAFGAGVVLYFAAEREPWLPAPLFATVVCIGLAVWALCRERLAAYRAAVALAFLFAGFSVAALRTLWVAAPVIERPWSGKVTGFVETMDLREGSARLVLRLASAEGLAEAARPQRVRIILRGRPDFTSGASIGLTARLLPPPRASEPGGYDFARDAWFQRIGAVGNGVSRPLTVAALDVPWVARFNAWVDRGRNALTARIATAIGGANGAVAAALVTGKRGLIPEATNEALRAAGIYHVVSISGLHMVLAAGLMLWILRALLALSPTMALTQPIKRWAAAFAMIGAVAYDVFSGSEVATERALVMVLIMLGAVLFGRPAFSMRNLAIAALVVMLREPVTVLGPSFQMSFAAVAAMIAAFEKRGAAGFFGMKHDGPPGLLNRAGFMVWAAVVTTLIASLATDPYATFHFHRISSYGLIGNVLAIPLVEFVVMPFGALGLLASAFGLDGPCWWVMGLGVSGMMVVAEWVAGLAGSTRMIPAFGAGALLLMTLGLLWITLWQTPLRWLGVPFAVAGVALALTGARPDLMIDRQGGTLAYRVADGRLAVLNARGNFFGVSQWLTADADARPARDAALQGNGLCDVGGCTGTLRDGRVIVLILDPRNVAEDCPRADIVVTRFWLNGTCTGPSLIVDGEHLLKYGASEFRFSGDGKASLRSARAPQLDRPWSPAPRILAQNDPPVAASSPQEETDEPQ